MEKTYLVLLAGMLFSVSLFSCARIEVTEQVPEVSYAAGLDAFAQEARALLKEKKVGLIVDAASLNQTGAHLIPIVSAIPEVEVVAIFTPSQTFYDPLLEMVSSEKRTSTTTCYLVPRENPRPTDEMLKGIDLLIYDLQDTGVRFDFCLGVLALFMEEAAKHEIELYVLDRPNLRGGEKATGPIQDSEFLASSPELYYPIPLEHAMTVGELSSLFNYGYGAQVKLTVFPLSGWTRTTTIEDVPLPVPIYPGLKTADAFLAYPVMEIVSACGLSVGKGTDTAYEVFGAPFMKSEELTASLNALKIEGVEFQPIEFTPQEGAFAGEMCYGARMSIVSPEEFKTTITLYKIVRHLMRDYPKEFNIAGALPLIGKKADLQMLVKGLSVDQIVWSWREDLFYFNRIRDAYIKYR